MNISGMLVDSISDCLQTAADLFNWTRKRKAYSVSSYGIWRNIERKWSLSWLFSLVSLMVFFSQVKQRLMELYGDEILMIVAELPIQGLVLSRKTRSLLAVSFAVLINHTSSFYSPSHPPITSVDSFVSFLSRSTLAWPPLPSPTISPPP